MATLPGGTRGRRASRRGRGRPGGAGGGACRGGTPRGGGPPPGGAGGAARRSSPRRTRVGAEDAKEGGTAAQFGQRLGHRRVCRVRLHVHIENVLPEGRGRDRAPLLGRAWLQFGGG